MLLSDYRPRAKLVTHQTLVDNPRYPVFDAHNHLELFEDRWIKDPPALLAAMQECGVAAVVDLDGAWGEDLAYRALDLFKARAPHRFHIFGGLDFDEWPARGDRFGEWAARRVRAQAQRGVEGIKVWKTLGLRVTDQHGALVRINDPRLEPVWQAAEETGLKVNFHTADPVAFFDALDETNERWEELQAHPDWQFPSPPFPPFLSLVEDMLDVVRRHPLVTFIGSHVGCYAEDLGWVGNAFEQCPNFYIDISARLAELGRQPYTARRFFIQYADRILFGLDSTIRPHNYRPYYRFLETDDEYFPYSGANPPPVGRWNIYGIYLPDDVLRKVYWANAARLFNGDEGLLDAG